MRQPPTTHEERLAILRGIMSRRAAGADTIRDQIAYAGLERTQNGPVNPIPRPYKPSQCDSHRLRTH